MDVSIVIPLHNPAPSQSDFLKQRLNSQDYPGEFEVLRISGKGLAEAYNEGITLSKYPVIVTLHQDCIPTDNSWLSNLVDPLKDETIVATTGKVVDKENGVEYYPLLDGKNCAFKKEALRKVGLFDNLTFLNSGEDMDMFLKLQKEGKIGRSKCSVVHDHPGYLKTKSSEKLRQNANTWGCLFRRYHFKLPKWYSGALKSFTNPSEFYWFWRGFIKGKQDFRK